MEEKKNKFLYYLNTYCVERYLDQGSANCGLRARFYIEWNAARKKKFQPATMQMWAAEQFISSKYSLVNNLIDCFFFIVTHSKTCKPVLKFYCKGLKL